MTRYKPIVGGLNRGDTSGIGLATARQFVNQGANVVVVRRSRPWVREAQKQSGANGVAIAAGLTKSTELASLFKQVRFDGLGSLP